MDASTLDFIHNVMMAAGGVGLFLFGVKIMSDGLENMAGDRMRTILERATSNRLLGILVGAIVTSVIQSSTATTVMVVGLVNASMMTLAQAISVIMGTNIGTTITAQIIAFKVDALAPLFIFIGLIMYMFFKKSHTKHLGYIVLGFGILFFGITTMGVPLKGFSQLEGFQAMLIRFQNPILAVLAGIVFTVIIQSSSATTGIVVALYLIGVDLDFRTAAFLIMGTNIGTCLTAILVALPASRESKRAALAHVLFNVIGSLFFGTLIILFPGILSWIQSTWKEGARQVAMFHTLFNVSTTLVLLGFVKQFAILIHRIIPELPDENSAARKLLYLDSSVIQMPAIAITQAQRELDRMGQLALGNLRLALEAFFTGDTTKAEAVIEAENTIDFLNHNITTWLVRIRGLKLSEADVEKLGAMFHTVSDVERLGDHAENIAEYAMLGDKYGAMISAAATEELRKLSESSLEIVELSLDILKTRDYARLPEIDKLEQKVDDLSSACVENHIQRLQAEVCDPRGGVMFTDMVTDLERCSDHANNIAYSILGNQIWNITRRNLLTQGDGSFAPFRMK